MNYSEVKELLAAGFTHDEIMAFVNNPQNPQDNTQPTPEPTPEPTPDPTPEPTPEPTPGPTPESDNRFDQLNETMNKLIRTIQTSNLKTATFGDNKEIDLNSEVDKIMANLIRPEHDEKGGNSK